jgi:hypothetical protein
MALKWERDNDNDPIHTTAASGSASSSSAFAASLDSITPPPPRKAARVKRKKSDTPAKPITLFEPGSSLSTTATTTDDDVNSSTTSNLWEVGVVGDKMAEINKMKTPALRLHLIKAVTQLQTRQSHKACERLELEYKNQIQLLLAENEFLKKKLATEVEAVKQERDSQMKQVVALAELNARTSREEKVFYQSLLSRHMNTTDNAGASLISVLGKSQDHVSLAMQHKFASSSSSPLSSLDPLSTAAAVPALGNHHQSHPHQPVLAAAAAGPTPPPSSSSVTVVEIIDDDFDRTYPSDLRNQLSKCTSSAQLSQVVGIWLKKTISQTMFEERYQFFRDLKTKAFVKQDPFKLSVVTQTIQLFDAQYRTNENKRLQDHQQKLLTLPAPTKMPVAPTSSSPTG